MIAVLPPLVIDPLIVTDPLDVLTFQSLAITCADDDGIYAPMHTISDVMYAASATSADVMVLEKVVSPADTDIVYGITTTPFRLRHADASMIRPSLVVLSTITKLSVDVGDVI